MSQLIALRHQLRELRELGLQGSLFRVGWEALNRSGARRITERLRRQPRPLPADWNPVEALRGNIAALFPSAAAVAASVAPLLSLEQKKGLQELALAGLNGHIRCFGRWDANFGLPIDWQLCPSTGQRWDNKKHWSEALGDMARVGDVKLSWEVARFPQAYLATRAANFFPCDKKKLSLGLALQIEDFCQKNPVGYGIHWASGQEIAFRLMAWCFAAHSLLDQATDVFFRRLADALVESAHAIEDSLSYARFAVHNNHLLSESFALTLVAALLPSYPRAQAWLRLGRQVFEQGLEQQFYIDGAYIQQSHNYQRVALQVLLWAYRVECLQGRGLPQSWRRVMSRSVEFLWQQQNIRDGCLPNYGANDGALPSILSVCDFSDFRPTLQALSLCSRGERLYEQGPWDEEAAWFVGPDQLTAPLQTKPRSSCNFAATGFQVSRSKTGQHFSVLRCGSLRDRFSQIDMLHLDVWWRGHNVLVDAGSYLYNGDPAWHRHFYRTASHNTVGVDGRDQMLHWRQFKSLYWTQARLLADEQGAAYRLYAGEHFGFARQPGACVHRRCVLMLDTGVWVVVDRVKGKGDHQARLHWLAGDFPHRWQAAQCRLVLHTPAGDFSVQVFDDYGQPASGDLVRGREDPPRGWLSRYYGEKVPVPSLAVEARGLTPLTSVSVLGPIELSVSVDEQGWTLQHMQKTHNFCVDNGLIRVF